MSLSCLREFLERPLIEEGQELQTRLQDLMDYVKRVGDVQTIAEFAWLQVEESVPPASKNPIYTAASQHALKFQSIEVKKLTN